MSKPGAKPGASHFAAGRKVVGEGLLRYEQTVAQTFRVLAERLPPATLAAWRLAAQFEPEAASQALAEATGLSADTLRDLRRRHTFIKGCATYSRGDRPVALLSAIWHPFRESRQCPHLGARLF